jgi:membrane-associated phospholipid phosphatase
MLAVLVMFAYWLYWPLSRVTARLEPHHPETWIDRAAPLIPEAIFVYGLVWTAGALPLTLPTTRPLMRRIAGAYFVVIAVAFVVFVTYPVHMGLRPVAPPVTSLATWGVAMAYAYDEPSNCLPSLHVAVAVLSGLCAWSADRRVGVGGMFVAAAIAGSTLLVKQHYLIDVIAGAGLAAGAWWFVVRPLGDVRLPSDRRGPAGMIGVQLLLFAAAAVAHAAGVRPP